MVHAQFFPARKNGPAVLVLPNWNAKWHGQVALCHWLQRIGISALKMSLPYHDRRMAKGHERADQLVGPNIGLTLAANRQAVKDARACLTLAGGARLFAARDSGDEHRLVSGLHHAGA